MADEKLSKQDLRIAETRNRIEKENNELLGQQQKITSEIVDNLANALRIEKQKTEVDKTSLKLAKDINNFQQSIATSYDDIRKVQQDLNKASKLQNDLAKQLVSLTSQAADESIDLVKFAEQYNKQKEEAVKKEKSAIDDLAKKRLAYEDSLKQSDKNKQQRAKDEYNLAIDTVAAAREHIQSVEESKDKYTAQYEAIQAGKEALAESVTYLKEQEQVQKRLTTTVDKIENGFAAIGLKGATNVLGLQKFNEQAKKFRYELSDGGTKNINYVGKLGIAFKGLGAVIQTALGPLAMIALAIAAVKKLVDNVKEGFEEGKEAAKKISEENVGLARNLGLAQGAAAKLAANVRGMGPTQAQSVASAEALYGAMGGTEKLSQNTLKTFIQLNTYAGMSAENLAEFHTFAKLSGKDSGVVVKNMADTALAAIKNNKLATSQKVLLGDVAKVSDVVKLRYQGQEKELVKIVADARKYGLELAKAEDIANSLLNIEDSLSAEMEAELLTGKELNLEKAREAALNGDVATLQAEIAKNAGSIEQFNKMNVVQQEAYAKAVGLSRQDLAKMLKDQKANLAVNGNLVDEQQDGLAAMQSGITLAEKEENIERRKQEASISYFKALYPTIEKIKEAAIKVKAVFAEWFGKKLEALLKDPGVQNFINKLPENAEKMAKQVTEALDKLIQFFKDHPWLATGGLLFGGQIAGGAMKLLGGAIGQLGVSAAKGIGQKAGLIKGEPGSDEKNPSYTVITKDLTTEQENKEIEDYLTKQVNKMAKNNAKVTQKATKDNANMTKKAAKDISTANKKASKDISNATKKAAKQQSQAIKKGASDMKKATTTLNKNVKSFGSQTKKLFGGLKKHMSGLFKNLNAAVRRIGSKAGGGMGGMLGMLGPIGLAAGIALPAISALVSGEGFGGALEAIDPTGLVGAARSREDNTPEMAIGGIVTKRTKAIVGEAGPEAVIPLKEFYAKMDELITAVQKGGSVYMDSRKVGEALVVGGFKL
jgi:hypothetical protein